MSILVVLFTVPQLASAQLKGPDIPDSLAFQGILTDTVGVPIDSTVDLTFNLYKDGNSVWSQTSLGVEVSDGVFNVILGGTGSESLVPVAFNSPIELGVTLGGMEMTPRTPLTSAAYALGLRGLYVIEATGPEWNGTNLVGGSDNNQIGDGTVGATVFGGGEFTDGVGAGNRVFGATLFPTISGGLLNRVIDSSFATIGGGLQNSVSGDYAVVPGGRSNEANAAYSFAAGRFAKADHNGTFVWNGDTDLFQHFTSTGDQQFLIQAEGGVGIGTNAPEEPLHVKRGSGASAIFLGGDETGGPHGIVLDDDVSGDGVSLFYRTGPDQLIIERGSNGTTTNADDAFIYDRDDETFSLIRHTEAERHQLELRNTSEITTPNFGGIVFTHGSSGGTTLADLRVHYHNTGNTDVSLGNRHFPQLLFLEDGGQVGIGTTTPSEKLEVNGNVLANNVGVTSDRRLKRHVEPLADALALAERLQGVSYEWRTSEYPDRGFEEGRHLGFVAQDVEPVLPEAVHQLPDGTYSVRYQEVIPVLLEAVKELSEQMEAGRQRYSEQQALVKDQRALVEHQQTLIDDQRSVIADLSSRVAEIERRLAP